MPLEVPWHLGIEHLPLQAVFWTKASVCTFPSPRKTASPFGGCCCLLLQTPPHPCAHPPLAPPSSPLPRDPNTRKYQEGDEWQNIILPKLSLRTCGDEGSHWQCLLQKVVLWSFTLRSECLRDVKEEEAPSESSRCFGLEVCTALNSVWKQKVPLNPACWHPRSLDMTAL